MFVFNLFIFLFKTLPINLKNFFDQSNFNIISTTVRRENLKRTIAIAMLRLTNENPSLVGNSNYLQNISEILVPAINLNAN